MQDTAISGPNNGDDDDDDGGDDDERAHGCQGPIWPVASKVNATLEWKLILGWVILTLPDLIEPHMLHKSVIYV